MTLPATTKSLVIRHTNKKVHTIVWTFCQLIKDFEKYYFDTIKSGDANFRDYLYTAD